MIDNEELRWAHVPDPIAGPGDVLIAVAATAVNKADLLQRKGFYPPPPGASSILGLECSGVISAVGKDVTGFQIGDQVCALMAGGGYAELVAVPATQVLPIPDGVDLIDAAGLMEACCTVWSTVVMAGHALAGETLLIHGGGGGIGTTAVQIGVALGMKVAVTAGSAAGLQRCRDLGAQITINYRDQDFVQAVRDATDGAGADVILDVIGAKYLERNIAVLADGGRLTIIGMQGGSKAELNIGALMSKRGSIISTALRSRPVSGRGSKAEVVAAVRDHLWPLIELGVVTPIIGTRLPIGQAAQAHALMDSADAPGGKIVLVIDEGGSAAGG